MQLKKRTADQAGLDHATADALGKKMAGDMNTGDDKGIAASDSTGKDSAREGREVSAKDWLVDQVAKMEAAFKVCRKGGIRSPVEQSTDAARAGRLLLSSFDYPLSCRS